MRKQIEQNLSNLCTNGADGISPIVYVQTLMYTVGSLSKDTPDSLVPRLSLSAHKLYARDL